MNTTTTATQCETTGCDRPAEQGIRVLGRNGLADHDARMCATDATRVYNVFDYNRRGGRIELFDL